MRGLIMGLTALTVMLQRLPGPAVAGENYCHSKETNQRWEDLAADNPESDPI